MLETGPQPVTLSTDTTASTTTLIIMTFTLPLLLIIAPISIMIMSTACPHMIFSGAIDQQQPLNTTVVENNKAHLLKYVLKYNFEVFVLYFKPAIQFLPPGGSRNMF